jgi:5-methylcytosine-specific restriction endonuclease McrA
MVILAQLAFDFDSPPPDPEITKECKGCHKVLPLSAFPVAPRYKHGRHSLCVPCKKDYSARYHEAHREKKIARAKKHYDEHTEARKRYISEWIKRNPDKHRGYMKRWESENHAAVVAKSRRGHHNRKVRVKAAEGSWTLQEWQALLDQYDHRCLACNKQEPEIKLTMDHVIPLSKGGSNSIDNIQPLCVSCNSKKYTTDIDYRTEEHAPRLKERRVRYIALASS